MADPEMSGASDNPTAPAPAEAARPDQGDSTAIQEERVAIPQRPTAISAETPAAPAPTHARKELRKPSPEALARRVRVLDSLLVGLLLVLAFFLGSFTISNSDFWMHLATGRLLSEGDFTFGRDPFSYTTNETIWVNHAWLFDWLLYNLYQVVGLTGLVVLRGILCVALALVLLRIRQRGQSLWIPVICVILALLTASNRLFLNSELVSVLFLALTLYLLHRGLTEGATFSLGGRSFSPLWLLPPLFALWVNLDGWFILGPLTVGLFWLGAAVQRLTAGPQVPGKPTTTPGLGIILVAGLAACLLNPYFHRAFTLPLEMAYPLAGILPEGLVSRGVAAHRAYTQLAQAYRSLSPLEDTYWSNNHLGLNVAGIAYFVLLLLSLISFILAAIPRAESRFDARRFPVGLFLLWLLLAGWSAASIRMLLYFAIVAGPAAALNFQEWARRRSAGELTWGQWSWAQLGRAGTVLACVGLLLLAWPGWLHGNADSPRTSHRVRWDAYRDPSLAQAAQQLQELIAAGKVTRGFNLTTDAAYLLDWYAPDARVFFDSRFVLPPHAAEDYARARKSLREAADVLMGTRSPSRTQSELHEMQRVFRAYKIDYLVLTGLPKDPESVRILNRLVFEPRQWVRLYEDGRTAIFAWRDPGQLGNPFAGLGPDYNRMAFGNVPEAQRAPLKAPPAPVGPLSFWERYAHGKPATPPAADEAHAYLVNYVRKALSVRISPPSANRWQAPYVATARLGAWLGPMSTAAVVSPQYGASLAVAFSATPQFNLALNEALLMQYGVAPPALPILGARAARRAVAEVPTDAAGYEELARAYDYLRQFQELHWTGNAFGGSTPTFGLEGAGLTSRQSMRFVQCVAALKNAVRVQPDNTLAHIRLSELLEEANYPDAALEHAQLAREHPEGFRQLFDASKADKADKALEDRVRKLRKEVDRRMEEYRMHSASQSDLGAKVQIALFQPTRLKSARQQQVPRGLINQALKLLREADPGRLNQKQHFLVANMQIYLMLILGRTRELQETVFDAANKDRLAQVVGPNFHAYEALYAAAVGDYQMADRALATLEENRSPGKLARELPGLEKQIVALQAVFQKLRREKVVFLVQQAVLGSVIAVPLPAALPGDEQWRDAAAKLKSLNGPVSNLLSGMLAGADRRASRGLLWLEQGDIARAREHFRASQQLAKTVKEFVDRTHVILTDPRIAILSSNQPVVARYLGLMKQAR